MPPTEYFTDPELHAQIEEDVEASNEGGSAGEWSDKKAEIVEEKYEEQGGEYKDDNTMENGNESKKQKQNDKEEDGEGKDVEMEEDEDKDADEEEREDAHGSENEDEEDATTGEKRKRPTRSQAAASKKAKANSGKSKDQSNGTHGSKHDSSDEPAPKGSNDRLPKKGQRVSWKAMPGWVHGKVLEVVIKDKDMQGKHIKASKEEPRIALEADSGKFCVHKPDNCYFEDP